MKNDSMAARLQHYSTGSFVNYTGNLYKLRKNKSGQLNLVSYRKINLLNVLKIVQPVSYLLSAANTLTKQAKLTG